MTCEAHFQRYEMRSADLDPPVPKAQKRHSENYILLIDSGSPPDGSGVLPVPAMAVRQKQPTAQQMLRAVRQAEGR